MCQRKEEDGYLCGGLPFGERYLCPYDGRVTWWLELKCSRSHPLQPGSSKVTKNSLAVLKPPLPEAGHSPYPFFINHILMRLVTSIKRGNADLWIRRIPIRPSGIDGVIKLNLIIHVLYVVFIIKKN